MITRIQTEHPIAAASVDHLHPRGTKNDNSTNLEFNRRLFRLFGDSRPVVLDLGCSGGGFVRSLLDMGAYAVGVEGSDYSKRNGRAEWPSIPDALFTADIGEPFLLIGQSDNVFTSFNVVTMWEVLEHLGRDQLERLNHNVHVHLRRGGFFIASINSSQDRFEGVDYHRTVLPPEWWRAFFRRRGWIERTDLHAFFAPEWVRGPNTEGAASTCFVFER